MALTLLVDLDDTLLDNPLEQFLPAYLEALASRFAPALNRDQVINNILIATGLMMKNRRPDITLKEVFETSFYSGLGIQPGKCQALLDTFYAEDFPKLRRLTQPRPAAREFILGAFERGFKVGIATNALWPHTAIQQRLEWAELGVEIGTLEPVPTFDRFHFAKPDPAFFAELLASMGWPDGAVIVVGDDGDQDIQAARQLGMTSFWIRNGREYWGGDDSPSMMGELGEVLPWIDEQARQTLLPNFTTPEAMQAILRSTPAAISSLCKGLSETSWRRRPAPGEWAPVEIIYHLRDVDQEIHLPRLHALLQQSNPFLPGQDGDPWAEQRGYLKMDGPRGLRDYLAVRMETIELLRNLTAEDWQRPARHAIFGPTLLSELVNIVATHDRLHIRQLFAGLNLELEMDEKRLSPA